MAKRGKCGSSDRCYFLSSRVTADSDCGQKIKRCFLLGRKAMRNLAAAAAAAKSLQSCPTLSDPMDCSLPGFSVHGIVQAIVLEWVAIAFSREI